MSEQDGPLEFCRREYPRLVGSLSLYCRDPNLAEELAQDTLVRVCRDWARVRDMAAPGAWAHRVAINLANSWFRRLAAERRATRRLSVPSSYTDPDAGDITDVRKAIHDLPERQRMAIVLRYYADLPVAQVAQIMKCAQGTVRAHTSRALVTLRGHLDIGEMDDASRNP